jgi:L-ascorbate metabolism protein UlaG (beta-lactamase superfamily)
VRIDLRLTYIGGPTLLLQVGGLRLLTDPTFDPAGAEFRAGAYVLRKTHGPGLPSAALGRVDAVLLSHDHHFDNLDAAGRAFLGNAGSVLTTGAGAERLGGRARGVAPWQTVDLPTPDGRTLTVTATPARHGPAHADRGPVVGFVLALADEPGQAVYLSGDTVWYDGVAEVSRRFSVRTAVLFMGAARVEAVGPWHLTFTAAEGVEAARAFGDATIVPVHFEDWEHFSESRPEIDRAFAAAGLDHRLRWLPRGVETEVPR